MLYEADRIRRAIVTFHQTNDPNYAQNFLFEQMVSIVLMLPQKERKVFVQDMDQLAGHTLSIPIPETRTIH